MQNGINASIPKDFAVGRIFSRITSLLQALREILGIFYGRDFGKHTSGHVKYHLKLLDFKKPPIPEKRGLA
jgi:hypothetical protein